MALTYFDRDGTPISEARWLELSGKHNYAHLATTIVDLPGGLKGTVETSWCGCVSNLEQQPGVFVTRLLRKAGHPCPLTRQQWHRDRDKALFGHERFVEELSREGGEGQVL